ncbi:CAPA peptides [Epargyreus clarus]|uniref:CAPA peptides n=1 Tax=Epargyreus clarus TaxID=520877 RepID=UPI003C2B8EF8
MQSAGRIILSLFVISHVVTSAYHSGAKLRRDGVLNLYPFPRVGRSGPQTWKIPINDLYLESEPAIKRQLYAFPRVGRTPLSPYDLSPLKLEELLLKARGRSHGFVKRESEGDPDNGMWFGPRLGRGFRSDDDDVSQNGSSERSEQEQIEPDHVDREKRQTKHA